MNFKDYTAKDWIRLVISLLILVLIWYFRPGGQDSPKDKNHNPESSQRAQNSGSTSDQIDIKAFTGTNYQVLPKGQKIPVNFVRIVDGDTVVLSLNGHEFRTRYLMIDTPESVKEGLKPQPYGKDAAHRNQELLTNAKQVSLEFDKGPYADDYDRALAYVYADDKLVSLELVKEGLASVSYVNPPNNSQEKTLRQAQKQAKTAKKGIWSIPNYVNDKGKFTIQE